VKKWGPLILIALLAYLSCGFYLVRGNEAAVVRRFGRVLTTEAGTVALKPSGLHYDLPWPFTRVDRIRVNEVRTLTIGTAEVEDIAGSQFLQAVDPARQAQFVTGDKNILNLYVTVHYRVSETHILDYLFGSENPERRLQTLAESALADLVLRSGVDFVHTLGRNELREQLVARVRDLAEENRLGLVVEDVAISNVYPPLRVKAQFIDVMNARADKETYINEARAYAEQKLAEARALAQKKIDEAEAYRQRLIEEARARADSFLKMIAQFRAAEREGIQTYAQARQMALRRYYIETMEGILRKVAGKVFLDSGKPVDLTIFRDPTQ